MRYDNDNYVNQNPNQEPVQPNAQNNTQGSHDANSLLNLFDDQPNHSPNYNQSTIEYKSQINTNYPYMSGKAKKEKTSKRFIGFGAAVISLSFVFAVAGTMLGNSLSSDNSGSPLDNAPVASQENTPEDTNNIINTATSGAAMTIEQVAAAASNSIVEITTESLTTGNRMQQFVSTGAGSGVIISKDGYIVTNNHVIADSSKITVTLKDGTQHQATLVGTDEKTDVAVIKITATNLSPVTFGTSADLKVGQDAIAIGNPLGQLGGTVTNGIISALDREITIDGETMKLLQTNAAINPGNSGGGLFNIKGQLIGIVNAKSSGSDVEGLGFAIPVDIAKPIIEDLIEFGYVQGRVELGISLVDIEDSLTAMMYRVNTAGVYIMNVNENSVAARAGLQAGDRIVSFDGKEIANSTEVTTILDGHSVGDTITIVIDRDGQTGKVDVTLQQQGGSVI